MDHQQDADERSPRLALTLVLLCLLGLALNVIPARLALAFELPLYLDSAGTILTTMYGGFLPGVIVGFLTNVINGISDPITMYYSVIQVLIATATLFLHRRHFFENAAGLAVCIIVFSLIGGSLGSILTYCLYGFSFGEGISAPYAHIFYDMGHFPLVAAQLIGDTLVDAIDKGIVVFVCALLYVVIPQSLNERFARLKLLEQSGLADTKGKTLKNSLLRRVVAFLLLFQAILIVIVSFTCFRLYRNKIIESNTELAAGAANFASRAIVPEKIDTYLERGDNAPGYADVEEQLSNILDSIEDLTYLYVYRCQPDGIHVVFDIDQYDSEGNLVLEGEDPGTIINYDESFAPYYDALLAGEEIDPIITNDTYGWLLTVYTPIRDANGLTQAYACADIAVEDMNAHIMAFLAKIVSMLISAAIVVLYTAIYYAERSLIIPINTMEREASGFAFGPEGQQENSLASLRGLNIHTGDEIEQLYDALKKLATDSTSYIDQIRTSAAQITQMQEAIIVDFANMVEARDQNTGDHIQKTAFYVDLIGREMLKEGLYPDELDEKKVREMIQAAPLHDVGKIKISDTLLNKPGRLTDEEFELMKTHTTEGMKILSDTLTSAGDAGYLSDSIDMAWCHHEWWNGRGYPRGLVGEEIPLAARVMAVADVFDALVSRRSYKRPFTFDKAVSIIREEAGTHFDPQVATAFLNIVETMRETIEEEQRRDEEEHTDDPDTLVRE